MGILDFEEACLSSIQCAEQRGAALASCPPALPAYLLKADR